MDLTTKGMSAIAVAGVAIVLVLGLRNMMRGGPANTSQLLMRWRVGMQFLAIVVLLVSLYLAGR